MSRTNLNVTLDRDTIRQIDEWREHQPDHPSQAEAVCRLLNQNLSESNRPLPFTSGEKLIVGMLCDLLKQFSVNRTIDPSFVESALFSGHHWALEWQYPGVYERPDRLETLEEVLDVLQMWRVLEYSYDRLSGEEKILVKDQARLSSDRLLFGGFDGNEETEHLGIALFLIEEMERYEEFKGRTLNTHSPTLRKYRSMVKTFEAKMKELPIGQVDLSAEQIIEVLNSR